MAVHEFGHVLAAWATGGSVARVVLHPLQISWSAFAPNPRPLLVAWSGPLLGSLLPAVAFLLLRALRCPVLLRALRCPGLFLVRFFAGFCLVANGLYLFIDAFTRDGDGGTLLRHGAASWELWLFAGLVTPLGFWLWHGLGPHFGLGEARGRVSHRAAFASLTLSLLIGALEMALARDGGF